MDDEGDDTGLERLSPDERAFHDALVAERRAWEAAWGAWTRHLAARYRLQPHDALNEDGTILRGASTGAGP